MSEGAMRHAAVTVREQFADEHRVREEATSLVDLFFKAIDSVS
jgi:hypothetical protein